MSPGASPTMAAVKRGLDRVLGLASVVLFAILVGLPDSREVPEPGGVPMSAVAANTPAHPAETTRPVVPARAATGAGAEGPHVERDVVHHDEHILGGKRVGTHQPEDGLAAIGLLGWMLWLNWKLTLLSLALTPAILVVVKVVSVRLRRSSRDVQRSMGDVTQVLQEAIEGHKVVKLFGGQAILSQQYEWAERRLEWMLPEGSTVATDEVLARFSAESGEVQLAQARGVGGDLRHTVEGGAAKEALDAQVETTDVLPRRMRFNARYSGMLRMRMCCRMLRNGDHRKKQKRTRICPFGEANAAVSVQGFS